MQTLIPESASATARPMGRFGRWAGFGLTARALLLFCAGLLLAIPAFWHPRRIGFMLAWDALLLLLCVVDALRLPRPEAFTVRRAFLDSPQLGEPTRIEIAVRVEADVVLDVRVVDDLHQALVAKPEMQRVEAFPREDAVAVQTIYPAERGDFAMGRVYLRYSGALRLVERWASAEPVMSGGTAQRVRVFPAHEDSRGRAAFFLLRARQIELQRRKLQLRGTGREFESLRDFQQGDELRNISWTATARRGKLVARQFTAERSQQVWVVLDAGRLSRTAFELRRGEPELVGETVVERDRAHRMVVTQLDQAATAAVMLAQVVSGSGDKFAMMAYGREVRQVLPPGAGTIHTRLLLDLLSQTRAEAAEADHLIAVARLKTLQRRRGLMVWITELVDSAGRPELVTAASELVRRHLVVLVLLRHPELEALAARVPKTREEMFHSAAAQEMLERRRETVAQLERRGVLIVETTAEEIGVRAVSEYLEVKARGML
ncbi:MAG TPA: DUF58 domain-containing protein [Acidobacteriaceae bacterium]|jgi:uncharacterized protein (DUF58 family)|nr:DUF58 domain-containing protein [Acidobacteriaceae bacterium]